VPISLRQTCLGPTNLLRVSKVHTEAANKANRQLAQIHEQFVVKTKETLSALHIHLQAMEAEIECRRGFAFTNLRTARTPQVRIW
jgi:hypothetical protein